MNCMAQQILMQEPFLAGNCRNAAGLLNDHCSSEATGCLGTCVSEVSCGGPEFTIDCGFIGLHFLLLGGCI